MVQGVKFGILNDFTLNFKFKPQPFKNIGSTPATDICLHRVVAQ